MRRLILATMLLSSVLGAQTTGAFAQSTVSVDNAWSRAQMAGRNGAVYLTLTGKEGGDRLTGASSPAAGKVELHESVMDQGVMKMREVKEMPVPAGGKVTLQPGGLHLMLMNLKQPLKEGETVSVTLVFEKAGAVTTMATIAKAGAAMPDAGHGQHGHQHR